ncbi:beta-lactamase family protein [Poronia punctata]|nr:beta-lactamase family protein [Poronia punctata]
MDLFKSEPFSSHVRELMSRHHIPGLVIAVVQDEDVATAGYGSACLETTTPCTGSTLFDIASSAKSLTAAAVGMLVEDNERYPEIQYETPMSSLLPDDFVMPGVGYTEGVTVEDMLSHRTGMASHDCSLMSPRAASADDARSVTRNLRNLAIAAPIRARYLYCNMMYTVVTHMIEVKTQQSFSTFLEDRIFQPLGMTSTSLQPSRAREKGLGDRIATGYYWDRDTSVYKPIAAQDSPEGQGAGSIVTCADDFVRWIKCLLRREDPVNESVYNGLVRMRSIVNPSGRRLKRLTSPALYAAGLEIYYYRGHMVVGHNGVTAGFGSHFIFLPDLGFGVVVLGNSDGVCAISTTLFRTLIDSKLGVSDTEIHPPNKGRKKKEKKATSSERADGFPHDQRPEPSKQGNDIPRKGKKAGGNPKTEVQLDPRKIVEGMLPSQDIPLTGYSGTYWHPGYRTMVVQIQDGKLFIDGTDRSLGFTLTFESLGGEGQFTAYLSDMFEGGRDPVRAMFATAGGRATRMGLDLEPVLKELIWFDLVRDSL